MSIKSSPEFTPIVEPLGKPLTGQHPYTCGKDPHPWVYGCRCHAGWGAGWALDIQGLTHGIPYRLHWVVTHLQPGCMLQVMSMSWAWVWVSHETPLGFPVLLPSSHQSWVVLISICTNPLKGPAQDQ